MTSRDDHHIAGVDHARWLVFDDDCAWVALVFNEGPHLLSDAAFFVLPGTTPSPVAVRWLLGGEPLDEVTAGVPSAPDGEALCPDALVDDASAAPCAIGRRPLQFRPGPPPARQPRWVAPRPDAAPSALFNVAPTGGELTCPCPRRLDASKMRVDEVLARPASAKRGRGRGSAATSQRPESPAEPPGASQQDETAEGTGAHPAGLSVARSVHLPEGLELHVVRWFHPRHQRAWLLLHDRRRNRHAWVLEGWSIKVRDVSPRAVLVQLDRFNQEDTPVAVAVDLTSMRLSGALQFLDDQSLDDQSLEVDDAGDRLRIDAEGLPRLAPARHAPPPAQSTSAP